MSKLPSVSGRDAMKAFERAGFVEVRSEGSHRILKKEGHRFLLSVPDHDTLKTGTLRALIRSAGLTVEEFCEYLNS